MTLEERLNETLEEKENEIEELKEEVDKIKEVKDLREFSWQFHQYFTETDLQKKLPVPRLEMRFRRIPRSYLRDKDKWYHVEWVYGIVYKHFANMYDESMLFVPLSKTTSNGGDGEFSSWLTNGKLQTPFRDGTHIEFDSELFNLPAYIICEEKNICEEIHIDRDFSDDLKKMKRE